MPEVENEELTKKKVHREPKSGRKAEKKKLKTEHTQELTAKQRNPKAFTFNSAVRAERRFRRKQDIDTKKEHVPLVDRTPLEPPPVVVAIVGPPKVGKTTLIQCLIKNFTKQPLTVIKGPVTLVSGKKRRLTIMECNNDINSMIDIAKVADLVLLLVDASFGFEMEIFEFLNICQVHGMPRIMGVLTHLDMLKNTKQLKRTKKTLKHRFWTEVYDGAKLFYLSGLLHGEYLRNEIRNLGRFISVMKFRPLAWRSSHSYILSDRIEDITPPEDIRQNPKVDRTVCVYGYVRGLPLNKQSSVHIPGCGDLKIKDVAYLPDPCPLPDRLKRRSLVEKERLIYAPFSGVGGIVYDKDAVYVELGGSHSHERKIDDDEHELVNNILETQETLDTKLERSKLQIFSNTEPLTSMEVSEGAEKLSEVLVADDKRIRRKVIFNCPLPEEITDDSFPVCPGKRKECESTSENECDPKRAKINSGKESLLTKVSKKILDTIGENSSDEDIYSSGNSEFESDDDCFQEEDNDDDEDEEEYNQDNEEEFTKDTTGISGSASNISPKAENLRKKEVNRDFCTRELGTAKDKEIKNQISNLLSNLEKTKSYQETLNSDITENCLEKVKKEVNENLIPRSTSEEIEETDSGGDDDIDSNYSDDDDDDDDFTDIEDGGDISENECVEATNSDDGAVDSAIKWKENLAQKAADAYIDRQTNSLSLWKLVYGEEKQAPKEDDVEDEVGGLFRVVSQQQQKQLEEKDLCNAEESSRFVISHIRDWEVPEVRLLIRDCFVTGSWKESEDAEELLRLDNDSDEDELYGDFEDLETGEKHTTSEKPVAEKSEPAESKKQLMEKKLRLKEKFDAEYDDKDGGKTYYDELKEEVNLQAQLNKKEFEGLDDNIRVQLEGFRPGMYVRMELLEVPSELTSYFDPTYPLIVGGLQSGEENIGYVQVRAKKHRWYKKILKTKDPLIVSLGWRRFQTLPIYAKLDDNLRHRYLKYTPEHVSCMLHFWGPITPQGTGFLAVQDVSTTQPGFRIAATGSVVELDKSAQIMKKLKLTGVPMKIYKKTAFIKGMFSSTLEVAKFEGAKLRTVSGIRGQIKKAVSKPEGCFRATFEDKIQLSDIIFCRTWFQVDLPKFYNPVTSLLLPPDKKNLWRGMKTVGQLKREKGVHSDPAFDSLYTPIQREPKAFAPLVIPKSLQKALPYKVKPKYGPVGGTKKVETKRIAVVREPHEQKVAKMMKMIKTSYRAKQEKLKSDMKERRTQHKKQIEKEHLKLLRRHKEAKKQFFSTVSKMKGEFKPKKR